MSIEEKIGQTVTTLNEGIQQRRREPERPAWPEEMNRRSSLSTPKHLAT